MNARGQTICLNMIVKNEAPVIRRCLDSVRPLIDYWVIVDTGSSDNTQHLIREQLKDIPGELHERPWQDFAHNRSEALTLARNHCDYLLLIDADEVIEISPDFQLPNLTCDSYNIQIRYGGCTYLRRQLVRSSLPWRYEGVVHEYITSEQARTEDFLPGLQTLPHHDGARARDATTYRRDALILEKALLEEPQNARYVFYLAQSYRDAGDLELATRNYKRRVELGGWREEVWHSLYQIARLEERTESKWDEVMTAFLAAWQYQPDRAEPLYRIAMHYQAKAEYHLSHLFFSRAMKVDQPAPNRLFVEHTIYDYQLPLEYAVACYYVGDHAAAIATNNQLLRSQHLPAHAVDQVVRNRRFSLDALFPKPANQVAPATLLVIVPFRDPGPELDDLIHSLLLQSCDSFQVVFLDCASRSDHSARLPLLDPRFSLIRMAECQPLRTSVSDYLRKHTSNEIVLVLPAESRLAAKDSLENVRTMFADVNCKLAYSQFRLSSGALGCSEPAANENAFCAELSGLAAGSPVAFRSSLLDRITNLNPDDWNDLFLAAGFSGTRFSDMPWTSETVEAAVPNESSTKLGPAPPMLTGKLPTISCLMVTLDRLTLAKRAIRSFALQDYPELELVIVSDGTDVFRQSLTRYVEALGLQQVKFVHPGPDRLTLGQLRNISLDHARGDIICQWDDDDYSHPLRLTVQAQHMMSNAAAACLLTDHLHFIEDQRLLCWIDWTMEGASQGAAQLAPGTLMMFSDSRFRYPENGAYARQGEDSVLLEELYKTIPVAHLSGAGHYYLYQYHGDNTFSREHHYQLASCRTSNAHLLEHASELREAARHYPIPRPYLVVGREGPAFALN